MAFLHYDHLSETARVFHRCDEVTSVSFQRSLKPICNCDFSLLCNKDNCSVMDWASHLNTRGGISPSADSMNSMKLVIPLHLNSWKKDSKRCCDTTTAESIHTKDESKRGSAFAFIFGVNWPVQWTSRNDKFHGIHARRISSPVGWLCVGGYLIGFSLRLQRLKIL